MTGSCDFTVELAGEDGEWSCHRDAHEGADVCVFHMDAAAREAAGLEATDVRDRLLDAIESGEEREKRLVGADLPHMELDHRVVDSEDRHPVDLREATIEGLNLRHSTVRLPLHMQGADVGTLVLDNVVLEKALRLSGGTVGAVDGFEALLEGDADLDEVTFQEEAEFVETAFEEDVTFEGATFEPVANFRGASVAGGAVLLDNNGSFAGATFEDDAHFDHAEFEGLTFTGAEFTAEAGFQEATFTGDVVYEDVRFGGEADFDEAEFLGDATFDGASFEGPAVFRGIRVEGGAGVLDENFSFDDVTFEGEANFRTATFTFVDFEGVAIDGRAMFEDATFERDAVFRATTFHGEADFDETRFEGDAEFTEARFEGPAVFRGAEFTGESNHLADSVDFDRATFADDADFDNCSFTSASFVGTAFGGVVDFAGSTFSDRVEFGAQAVDGDTYVDLTDASLAEGLIAQPADNWIRYDLTRATLGEVRLTGEVGDEKLLDYFRICDTTFDGFDFTAHREHFERTNWTLHEYAPHADADVDYALELSPSVLETTYLRAADAAKAQGARDAAVEFSILKAYHRRQKNVDFIRNERAPLPTRVGKVGNVIGNFAWHQVCGYGYRLSRVLATSVLVIVLWGFMYAILSDPVSGGEADTGTTISGLATIGDLATVDGLLVLGRHMYFSLITFTTVGYGDVNPLGPTARALAATEGALGVLLASLVVFVLGRRVAL
jgi:uncharacterized protein YjbI with pentapeptide repeats